MGRDCPTQASVSLPYRPHGLPAPYPGFQLQLTLTSACLGWLWPHLMGLLIDQMLWAPVLCSLSSGDQGEKGVRGEKGNPLLCLEEGSG